jgi:hypothetical protein
MVTRILLVPVIIVAIGLINNTIMTEAQKLGGKAGSEVLIESARDSIIKKVNE